MLDIAKNLLEASGYTVKRSCGGRFRFEEEPPNNPNDISIEAATRIIQFANRLDFFYGGRQVREEVQIEGAWKSFLMEKRKVQSEIYRSGLSPLTVAIFHEEMFFNELVTGLWNYGHITRGLRPTAISRSSFMADLNSASLIYPDDPLLVARTKLPVWGHGVPGGIVRYTDIAHSIQAKNINDAVGYLKTTKGSSDIALLEIGSGFGGLAEKLLHECKLKKLVLVDIPHNLVTAYYYLSQSLIEAGGMVLASSISELMDAFDDSNTQIVLCPTCFYDAIRTLEGEFVVGNFGSFSEMDKRTIEYYLRGIPDGTSAIVNTNSNKGVENSGSHIEIPADQFPIPSEFSPVYSGPSMCQAATNGRYKTTIHLKK